MFDWINELQFENLLKNNLFCKFMQIKISTTTTTLSSITTLPQQQTATTTLRFQRKKQHFHCWI